MGERSYNYLRDRVHHYLTGLGKGYMVTLNAIVNKNNTSMLDLTLATVRFRNCIASGNRNCKAGIRIWYVGNDNKENTLHIFEAQSKGIGVKPLSRVRRNKSEQKRIRQYNRNHILCKGKVGGNTENDCDEYPYLSTEQGDASKNIVSLKPISSDDNQQAGRDLYHRFYMPGGVQWSQSNRSKSWFGVISIPGLPLSVADCNYRIGWQYFECI